MRQAQNSSCLLSCSRSQFSSAMKQNTSSPYLIHAA